MRKFNTISLNKANIEQGKSLGKNELKYIMGGYTSDDCPGDYVLCSCPDGFYRQEFCIPAYLCSSACNIV
jgi:natural product precursor